MLEKLLGQSWAGYAIAYNVNVNLTLFTWRVDSVSFEHIGSDLSTIQQELCCCAVVAKYLFWGISKTALFREKYEKTDPPHSCL